MPTKDEKTSGQNMPEPKGKTSQRSAARKSKLDAGPKRGAKGEYLPAAYGLDSGNIRRDN